MKDEKKIIQIQIQIQIPGHFAALPSELGSHLVADPHSTPLCQHSECQHVHAHGDCKQQSNVWD